MNVVFCIRHSRSLYLREECPVLVVGDSSIGGTLGGTTPLFFCYDTGSSKAPCMSANREVKGMLAKCLSTENLIVEYKNVSTASFDVERRVLVLPNWEKASDTVFTMLTQHESAHAIFTDNIDWTIEYPNVPKDIINVLEDVRVEKLFKRKYPGSARHFFSGYNELNDDDFFSTKEENLNELSLIDRINLYFKIGAFHNIAFTDEENEFVTLISQTETFDDVLKLSQELVEFLKIKRQKINMNLPSNSQMNGSQSQQSGEGENQEVDGDEESQTQPTDSMETESNDNSSQNSHQDSNKSKEVVEDMNSGEEQPSMNHEQQELESKTSKSFDEKMKELNDENATETNYVELPQFVLKNLVIPNDYIHEEARKQYLQNTYNREFFDFTKNEYVKYKKSAEKEVSYLVKEFECKKSADQYARASTARTGVLDTGKLHTYKFNEDLFRKVSVIPDGKNHGLIFILDWSGSMSDFILDTYKQLLNLIWFCRKVSIPFEVYAFSLNANAYVDIQPNHPDTFNKQKGVLCPEHGFRMLNFFTSKVNNRTLDEQLQNIWAVCYAFQCRRGFAPRHLDLSGSPIGESIMSLHALIPDFVEKNKVQKTNVIFLTDGEGYVNGSVVERTNHSGEKYFGASRYYKSSIRDRRSGRVYRPHNDGNFPEYAKILLETVKDKFPMVNLINFRIASGRELSHCFHWYGNQGDSYEAARTLFKKNHFITFKNTGFDQFNVLATNSLSQDDEFEVAEDATKAQIRTAFSKMLGKKKTNKKVLSSFVDLIA